MNKHLNCISCSSSKIQPLSGYYQRHQLVKCKGCGLVFMERNPTKEELNKYYSLYSYGNEGELSLITIKSYEALLDEFEKYRKTNKILDVGCGRGWFLVEAKKRGWEVYGTEYSDAAISICESKGLKMRHGKLCADSFSGQEFDVITSFEVLEHINNPNEEVSLIYQFLRTGGVFYCTTPNFNAYLRYYLKESYNIIEYPEHLTYYTPKTLRKLMRRNGFSTSKVLTTGISISRFVASTKTKEEIQQKGIVNSDELLRQKINDRWYLGYAKSLANLILTFFGIGISLKGYFLKK